MAICCHVGYADGGKVLTVNGQQTTKPVTRLTFSGNSIVLHFSDGTTEAVDMSSVVVTFNLSTAVKALETAVPENGPTSYFDLSGHQLKEAPQKGSYIMKKGNKTVKLLAK